MILTKDKFSIENIINYLIILYAFLLPLHKGIVTIIGDILVVLFFFQPQIKIKLKFLLNDKFFQIFSALFLYGIFINFYSPNSIYGIKYILKKTISYLPIFVIFLSIKKEFITYSISAFLSGLFISEIISYGIYFDLWHTTYNSKYVGSYDPTPFMHHTLYSLYLSIGILILFYSIIKNKFSKINLIYLFFFITMSINMFITGGRGGQIAFFITIFILLFTEKNKKLLWFIFLPIIIFILAYNFSPLFHQRMLYAIHDVKQVIINFNVCGSWGQRTVAWLFAWDILKNGYIFGIGFDTYIPYLKDFILNHQNYRCALHHMSVHLHNQFLTMFIEGGVIYLGLFIYMLYYLITLPIKDYFINKIKYIYLIPFIFVSITAEPLFFQSWSMHLFTFFTGIILGMWRIENEKNFI